MEDKWVRKICAKEIWYECYCRETCKCDFQVPEGERLGDVYAKTLGDAKQLIERYLEKYDNKPKVTFYGDFDDSYEDIMSFCEEYDLYYPNGRSYKDEYEMM
ncbi:unnamed protein product [Moneuplotes crassus]|uniref:Uncharacterized protein n=1 Tax=Euplotes crassus TaxID=5936 RepID=A0AAD2D658_EUPCR|nr:unnamed protein product [Moneuplotes crassus]